jgi:hypothetical protein
MGDAFHPSAQLEGIGGNVLHLSQYLSFSCDLLHCCRRSWLSCRPDGTKAFEKLKDILKDILQYATPASLSFRLTNTLAWLDLFTR